MKHGFLGLLLVSTLVTQSALAAKGDISCNANTKRGRATLFIMKVNGGLIADLNLMGERIRPYENVTVGPNPAYPRYSSHTVELTLVPAKARPGAVGTTVVPGSLTLRTPDLGVNGDNVDCIVQN